MMIDLKELIRAQLKIYINSNDDIEPGVEAKLIKIISGLLQGDDPSHADIKTIFENISVEV